MGIVLVIRGLCRRRDVGGRTATKHTANSGQIVIPVRPRARGIRRRGEGGILQGDGKPGVTSALSTLKA